MSLTDPVLDLTLDLFGLTASSQGFDGELKRGLFLHPALPQSGEMFLPVYSWLDVVPKGRNETKIGNLTDWVRRHDRYDDDGRSQSGRR
jgi:hypothetical protein